MGKKEKNENLDFYGMGLRRIGDIYEDIDNISQEIEELYGIDARLQYECGVSVGLGKRTIKNIESIFTNDGIIHTINNSSPDLRNNSYFGGSGVSKKYNEDGTYNEPGISKKK